MADERTCFAGDLTTDQIGRTIRVKTSKGTIIEDELRAVIYGDIVGNPLPGVTPKIYVQFAHVMPQDAGLAPLGKGFIISHTEHVTVVR